MFIRNNDDANNWYLILWVCLTNSFVLCFQEEGPKEDEESDKSVSEVNDEDDAEDGSEEVSG